MTIVKRWTPVALLLLAATACAGTESASSDEVGELTNDETIESAEVATSEQAVNGDFIGCRGTALHVCDEQVDPDYFQNHPNCIRNLTCDGRYWACDVRCPIPSTIERPNAMVKAAGVSTPSANLTIGYVYSYSIPPGYTSGSFHSNSLNGSSVISGYGWKELGLGVGVNGGATQQARVMCDVGSEWQTRKISSIFVRWNNGTTRSIPCNDGYCSADELTIGTGLVATCNFVAR